MSAIYEGDSWKHAPEPCVVVHLTVRTRAEQQRYVDDAYAKGRIDRDQWEFHTATISTLCADGSMMPATRR